jgi:hypothetical protein
VRDGIIAQLTRECGGNVHNGQVVNVISRSFEREIEWANPHSGVFNNLSSFAAKNAADLETDSYFHSAYRNPSEQIPHTKNNWICYNFRERRIVPTHHTIPTGSHNPGSRHLKSWLVQTSVDGNSWRGIAREENDMQLNGSCSTGAFPLPGSEEWRFIPPVNIGENHCGSGCLLISAWEIFPRFVH